MAGISEQLSFADESDEYREFLAKFKPKKTTDDCYTPANVYDAVADWVAEEYGVDRESFVRPFWPDGDYQRHGYPEGCIVVDNPPFSIITPIVRWYETHGVRYFLFAPYLVNFNIPTRCHVISGTQVTYENGAEIPTSFVTNLDEAKARSAPTLAERIKVADDENKQADKRQLPKYIYPAEVLTAAFLGKLSKYGIEFSVGPEECAPIGALDSQRAVGKTIFGHGYLLSERAAAERAAAERWQLSERERQIISMLGRKEKP
ncbi:MAG: hypothetical protein J6S63_10935 [Atopobiaceae bacterium]|nr:hypothetical protein [Atopobiaceae bacterium]